MSGKHDLHFTQTNEWQVYTTFNYLVTIHTLIVLIFSQPV